mmetsp:Transcript_29031/g.51930  ORF Transcript_29031/g.51930 Transcript_29031/m.51930 type:complete len:288 (-) Transcript_29031:182-1045(-)
MADIAHQDVEAVRQALRESLREYSLSQIAPAETSKHNFFFWLENSDNLVVTFREPSGIKVISATTGVVTHEIPVSESSEVRYAYSVDGTDYIILVFVNPFLFKVYSLTSGTFVHEAPLRTDPIPFRVSDKRVYIRQGNEVDVFDLRTLSVVHTFSFPNSVGYLGFSLDSKHVFVCVSGDNLYRIEAGTTTQTKVLSDKPEGWGDYFVYNPQLGVALCRANDVDYDDYSVVSLADSSIKPGLVVKRLLGFGTATSRGLVWVLQGKNSDQLQLLDPSTLGADPMRHTRR